MVRVWAVAATAALAVAIASLWQHSTKTAHFKARTHEATASSHQPPQPAHGVRVVHKTPAEWRAGEVVVPLATTSKQGGSVRFEQPYITVGNTPVGVFYAGGPLPPADFLQHDAASAGNIQFISLLNHPAIPLSSSIGLMSNLLILVAVGSFAGTIASEIALCTALQHIVLDDATVTGSLPSELGLVPSLSSFLIRGSGFDLFLPSELCQLSTPETFSLYGSSTTGTIPECLLSSFPQTNMIYTGTRLHGTIPPIGPHPGFLDLRDNALTGSLPDMSASLGDWPTLVIHLDLNQLSGTIPTQYGLLRHLLVAHNRLEGSIPPQIGLQRVMGRINATNNALSGPIPSQLGLAPLAWLRLGKNALTGTIPSQLGRIGRLGELLLDDNLLEGSVPSEFGLLSSLGRLDLSDNALSGTLPTQLLLLTNLAVFRVDGNSLSGPLIAPPNANVTCDFSGIDHPSCLKPTFEFVSGGAFATVVAGACGAMALELLLGAWLVARRNLERVEEFGLAVGLLTVGGVFLTSSSAVWYALASVRGSHSARSLYCRAALHSVVLGMHLTVATCAGYVGLACLRKRRSSLETPKSGTASSGFRVVPLVGLSLVPVVAITTSASVGVEASSGHGCDYNGASVVLVFVCPALLAVVACVTSAVSLVVGDEDHRGTEVAHMRRALGTNALFAVALVALAANLQEALPRFLALSLAALVSAVSFSAIVHVPLVRGK